MDVCVSCFTTSKTVSNLFSGAGASETRFFYSVKPRLLYGAVGQMSCLDAAVLFQG